MSEDTAKLTAIFEADVSKLEAAGVKADASMEATAASAESAAAQVSASYAAMGTAAEAAAITIGRADTAMETSAERAALFAAAQAKWNQETMAMGPVFDTVTRKVISGQGEIQTAEAASLAAQSRMVEQLAIDQANWAKQAGVSAEIIATNRLAIGKASQVAGAAEKELTAIEREAAEASNSLRTASLAAGASLTGMTGGANAAEGALSALLNPIGLLAAGLIAIPVAGAAAAVTLYEMSSSASEFGNRLLSMSEKTGLTINNLLALDVASKTTGSSLERIIMSVGMFEKRIGDAEGGTNRLAQGFKRLGIDTTDVNKALEQVIDFLAKYPEGIQRTQAAMNIFGRAGKDFAAVTTEMKGSLSAYSEELQKMGIRLGTDDVESARAFIREQVKLGEHWDVIKFKIESAATPIVEDWLRGISEWLTQNETDIISWGHTFVSVVGTIANAFIKLTEAMSTFSWGFSAGKWLGTVGGQQEYPTIQQVTSAKGKTSDVPEGVDPTEWYRMQGLQEGSYPTQGSSATAPPKNPFTKDAKHKGGGGAAAQATRIELQRAQVEAKMAEDVYRDLLDKQRGYYDQSLISLEAYSTARINAENDRYKKEQSVLVQEQTIIDNGTFKTDEQRKLAQSKQDEKELAAGLKHEQTLRQIKIDSYKTQIEADKTHNSALISLQEDALKTMELQTKRAVDSGLLSPVDAENQRFDSEASIYKNKIQALVDDANRISENAKANGTVADPNALRKLTDEIDAIEGQYERSVIEHTDNVIAARQKEVDETYQYAQTVKTLMRSAQDTDADTAKRRVDWLIYYTNSVSDAAHLQEHYDIKEEQRRAQRDIQDLSDQKAHLNRRLAELSSYNLEASREYREDANQVALIDKEIESIHKNSAQRIKDIHEQAQKQIYQSYLNLSSDIATIIQSGFEGGTKGLLQSLQQFLGQLSKELLTSAIFKLLQPNAPNQGSQAGGLLGTVANFILGKIGLGKHPAAEAKQDGGIQDNTVATTENTTAITDLTSALGGSSSGDSKGGMFGDLSDFVSKIIHKFTGHATQNLGGGSTFTKGGTGETRSRTVTTTDLANTTRTITDNATSNAQGTWAAIQLSAQAIVQGLTPARQGFLSGLLGAALSGFVSGALSEAGSQLGKKVQPHTSVTVTPADETTRPRRVGGKASGGFFGPNEIFDVGEYGRERVYTGDNSGYVVPNQMVENGGTKHITINLTVTDQRKPDSRSAKASNREMAERIAGEVSKHVR